MTQKIQDANRRSVKHMTLVGLMAALLCILCPFSIYLWFSPVPLSLAFLILYLSLYVLGMKKALLSCIIYLLIGLVGMPVFTGFTSGPGKFLGPTGGYLIGYLFLIVIAGLFIDRWSSHSLLCLLGLVLGTAACYLFGTVWLAYQNHMTFQEAFAAGVLLFLPGDAVKLVIALLIGPVIRKRLIKAGLFL